MIKILIADDEKLSRDLLKILISKVKIPLDLVGEASNGEEAIDLIFRLRPELVFLDIEMPRSSGIDVMKSIKDKYTDPIAFIVVTAFSYFEYAQASLRLGAKDILLKPIELCALEQCISRVIGYNPTDNILLNDILRYISINYKDTIQLNDCAKKFHISANQINILFNKHLNTTFIKYVNEFRISKAVEFIQNESLTIKEIANEVGFKNLNYFYKTFKKITGNTPGNFK